MQKSEVRYDPYFADIPWEIIKDENGKVIGEVYMVFPREKPEWIKPKKHRS
ncbi:hypothetical protein [Paenibacillus illinoisensis]|uniref:hypothetical protein n=1 Tax=Paenibacillus illinoisensis TaxID=59845 RepID=UPI00203FF18D|nr:hypothetical protein [Paenibacillus illinoisensis]MCM3208515.1 hypothetical protein [Paenibacillus illinoisensis]